MEELAKVLSLFGGDVSSWLSSKAIEQYCNQQLIYPTVNLIISVIVLVLLIIFDIYIYIRNKKNQDVCEDFIFFCFCITAVFCLVFIILLCIEVPKIIGWSINPDGMIIQQLLNTFSK